MKQANGYESRATIGEVEVRANEDGTNTISGLAAVFDSLSENLGGFREMIKPGAFDESDMSDVRALFNHDRNIVLGRTKSDTLQVERTEKGLRFSVDVPGTGLISDMVVEPIKRGDVSQASFGFIVGPGNDSWDENEDGVLIRTINRINRVLDVSPVTFPAYPDTKVAARSIERLAEETKQHEQVRRQHSAKLRELDLRSLRAG